MNETGLATALVSGDEEAGPSISGDTGGSRLYDVLQVGDDLHDGVDRLVLVPGELFLQTGSDIITEDVTIIISGESAARLIPVDWSAPLIFSCWQEVPQKVWHCSSDCPPRSNGDPGAWWRYL